MTYIPTYQNSNNPKFTWIAFLVIALILVGTYFLSSCNRQKEVEYIETYNENVNWDSVGQADIIRQRHLDSIEKAKIIK